MIKVRIESDPALQSPDKNLTSRLCKHLLNRQGIKTAEITIIFGDDALVSGLKKKFFSVEQLTDVIAFRLNDVDEESIEGEIYISLPRARENAMTYGEPYPREVARLVIHGGLHLLNYNDQTAAERKKMSLMENNYLDQFQWKELFTHTD